MKALGYICVLCALVFVGCEDQLRTEICKQVCDSVHGEVSSKPDGAHPNYCYCAIPIPKIKLDVPQLGQKTDGTSQAKAR